MENVSQNDFLSIKFPGNLFMFPENGDQPGRFAYN